MPRTAPYLFSAIVPKRSLGAGLASFNVRVFRVTSTKPLAAIDKRTLAELTAAKALETLGHLPGDRLVAELAALKIASAPPAVASARAERGGFAKPYPPGPGLGQLRIRAAHLGGEVACHDGAGRRRRIYFAAR